jgi:glutathione S-transferase
MSAYTLVIGNKNYSSWSLRPWLAMKMAGAAFREVIIPLRETDTAERIAEHSPAGKVPVLHDGEITVWESIAILEYLAEAIPEARLWPEHRQARAVARAASAEMHAGFAALRTNMPMNIRVSKPGRGRTPDVDKDIGRILALWEDCRARFGGGGPFLFGRFSNADAMYAPVVTRFKTYGVELQGAARSYAEAILALPPMIEWYAAGKAEPWSMPENDAP